MNQFKKLIVWQRSMNLCIEVYNYTSSFPDREKFALTVQMSKAAVSIPSNIAEGAGRNSNKEFRQFLSIANGSASELQTQLILAEQLKYIQTTSLEKLEKEIEEIQKMIFSLQNHLNALNEPESLYYTNLSDEHFYN